MIKRLFLIIAFFLIAMAGGIFATQTVWPYFVERPLIDKYKLETSPVYLTEVREIYIQENTALVEAVEKVEKVIVGVRSKTKAGRVLEGSGLIVTSDGLIVTLAELVPPGSEFSFFVENKPLPYQILKRDSENNLALVKLSDSLLTTTGFAGIDDLKIGERVFILGNLFKNDIPYKSVNQGIVQMFDNQFIYTNISEKPVLAGSPVFNIYGEVLGLSTIDSNNKVNAIPISLIREFIGL